MVNLLRDELGSDLNIGRNHAQCDEGGCDIAGDLPFSIEVKNHKAPNIPLWWRQACDQSRPGKPPVLIYKKPYRGWYVIMELDLISAFPTDNNDIMEIDILTFCNITRELINSAVDMNSPMVLRLDS